MHQSCLALGLIWLCRSQMPGWGWRHQSHRGHKSKVNFWSHRQLLHPSVWVWGQGLYICISALSVSPNTVCCRPLYDASLCLLLPPSCPARLLTEGFLPAALPPTLPGDLGLAPTKFSLLNPETSLLTQSHWIAPEAVPQETPLQDQGWPHWADWSLLLSQACAGTWTQLRSCCMG